MQEFSRSWSGILLLSLYEQIPPFSSYGRNPQRGLRAAPFFVPWRLDPSARDLLGLFVPTPKFDSHSTHALSSQTLQKLIQSGISP